MRLFKLNLVFSIMLLLLASCGSVKEGLTNQKKNNTDEFLVKKKLPLVMPPDYNNLPIPNEDKQENENVNIKSLISKSNNNEVKENLDNQNLSFEKSILKKIKKD